MPLPEPKVPKAAQAALALRLAGAGFEEIADAIGLMSAEAAREQVLSALAARAWGDEEGRERLRQENSGRLERLLRGVWAKATNPDHPEHLIAVRVSRELIDRLIRLHGLDAPAEVIVHSPTSTEIDAWVAAVVSQGSRDYLALEASVVE